MIKAWEDINSGRRQNADTKPGTNWFEVIFEPVGNWKGHGLREINYSNETVTYKAEWNHIDDAREYAFLRAAQERWVLESMGIAWEQPSSGVTCLISTDRDSQVKIDGSYTKALASSSFSVSNWKCANLQMEIQFINLSNADVISLGDAVAAHVGMAFNIESNMHAAIKSAISVEQIAAIFGES